MVCATPKGPINNRTAAVTNRIEREYQNGSRSQE